MYGKLFQRMYQGSMVGAGAKVFAVWGYCIANADPESHCVDLNPALLSAVLGESVENIKEAISYLASPDPDSHNKEQEGRRIIPTTGFEYFIVSHETYRSMTSNEDLRAYFREQKRKQRKASNDVLDILGHSQDPASASVSDFDAFWKAYPRKVGKAGALKAWKKHKPDLDKCLSALEWQMKDEQWQDKSYIPHPATWLNRGSWDDEVCTVKKIQKGTANGAVI